MSTRDLSLQSDISKMKTEPDGTFKRLDASFRNFIQKGGKFEPEKGAYSALGLMSYLSKAMTPDRYHLYVSYACPWATRTLIVRRLKGLETFIPVTVVSPRMGANGWPFSQVDSFPAADEDPLYQSKHVRDLYIKADPHYTGRFTVPVLWDKKLHTIVNNESSEIIRMFNTAFNEFLPAEKAALDFYPADLRAEIDAVNEWIYPSINNGVYRAGFATTQAAYDKVVVEVFDALDRVEKLLTGKDYLIGDRLTEADVRLWVTIVRFDPVYVGHFKCNIRTIRNGYPAINLWMRRLYWNNAAFKDSTNFEHIKTHYYWSHTSINPTRIVPVGPVPLIEPL